MSVAADAVKDPDLGALAAEFTANAERARRLLAAVSQDAFTWSPAPGRWSLADCLAHLDVTGRRYLPKLDETIGAARAARLARSEPLRLKLFESLFLKLMEPPVRRLRFKAPAVFQPPSAETRDEVLARFLDVQERWQARLRAADGLDLNRARVESPASASIKLGLGAAFRVMAAHERRHLWQAEQVKAAAGFPG